LAVTVFVWRYKSPSPAASDETGPVNQFVKQQTVHYISISRPNYRHQLFHCYVFTSTLYLPSTGILSKRRFMAKIISRWCLFNFLKSQN